MQAKLKTQKRYNLRPGRLAPAAAVYRQAAGAVELHRRGVAGGRR